MTATMTNDNANAAVNTNTIAFRAENLSPTVTEPERHSVSIVVPLELTHCQDAMAALVGGLVNAVVIDARFRGMQPDGDPEAHVDSFDHAALTFVLGASVKLKSTLFVKLHTDLQSVGGAFVAVGGVAEMGADQMAEMKEYLAETPDEGDVTDITDSPVPNGYDAPIHFSTDVDVVNEGHDVSLGDYLDGDD